MSTPMGKIVSNIMDDGGKLAVSSRGMGSLEQKNGTNYVKNDFYLATAADIVADPSAPQTLYKVLWKVKSGFGTTVSSKKWTLRKFKRILNEIFVQEMRITKH